jgi:hypothetical protein
MLEVQVAAMAGNESRTFLKTMRDGDCAGLTDVFAGKDLEGWV